MMDALSTASNSLKGDGQGGPRWDKVRLLMGMFTMTNIDREGKILREGTVISSARLAPEDALPTAEKWDACC